MLPWKVHIRMWFSPNVLLCNHFDLFTDNSFLRKRNDKDAFQDKKTKNYDHMENQHRLCILVARTVNSFLQLSVTFASWICITGLWQSKRT